MNKNIIDLEDYLENREAMPDIQSIAGERWFPEETNITEDMTKYWGGRLRCQLGMQQAARGSSAPSRKRSG